MANDSTRRCYRVTDVPTFFLEGLDPNCAVLDLHLGEQNVRLTKEAFFSMVGSLAKMAVDLLESDSQRKVVAVH